MVLNKTIIGRDEYIWLIQANLKKVPARVDTGARTTSIWASDIREVDGHLEYKLFGPSSIFYTGAMQVADRFKKVVVASSNGAVQVRYYIPITLQIKRRKILTHCTLADRSSQAYPILLGRNTLRGKFIVDVQYGSRILGQIDRARYNNLQSLLAGSEA
jgi:hypothetical protein